MNLTEFLLARIADDEADARKAMAGFATGTWTRDGGSIHAGHESREVVDWVYCDAWDHIARHDPARVLAECEAKRRIIAEWLEVHNPKDPDGPCGCDPATGPREMYEVHDGHADALSVALRALALPYADHPDYREEWRP